MNMTSINGRINNTGAKVPESESSGERKFHGGKVPGSERSSHRKFQGANWPGPIGTFAPESELARERIGCDSIHTAG